MLSRSALAATAGIVAMCAGITPALSYYKQVEYTPLSPRAIAQAQSSSSAASTPARMSSRSSSRLSAGISSSVSSKTSSASSKKTANATLNCMQKAAQKREEAISASLDAFYENMSRMLELRSGLIVKYWGEKDEKKSAQGLKTVWRSFGQAWRTSGLYMRAERRKYWEEYRIARTDCGKYASEDPEMGGLSLDSQY